MTPHAAPAQETGKEGSVRELALCTIVDAAYLPRTLALYRSLAAVEQRFRLYVFCADDETKFLLDRLALPNISAVALAALEEADPDLLRVKSDRERVAYLWTAKAAMCLYLLREADLQAVTYVDSDLFFYASPRLITSGLANQSIALVPHRFPPHRHEWEEADGIYNASFLYFRCDRTGLEALSWWRERCLEWCHDWRESGRYADQRYLNDFTDRFSDVQVIGSPGIGLAPWNSSRYFIGSRAGQLCVDDDPLVFHHFQSLRLFEGLAPLQRLFSLSSRFRRSRDAPQMLWTLQASYDVPERHLDLLWDPYVAQIGATVGMLRQIDRSFSGGIERISGRKLAEVAAERFSRLSGRWRGLPASDE
jgi:hypothetical protein